MFDGVLDPASSKNVDASAHMGVGVYCVKTSVPVRNVVGTVEAEPALVGTSDNIMYSLRAVIDPASTACPAGAGYNVVVTTYAEASGDPQAAPSDASFYLAFVG
jgi:hypothetical protein